jgi:predicted dienelactone hydrolase
MLRAMPHPARLWSRAAVLAFVAGCSSEPTTADYTALGPYGIGVHTFTFVDESRATPPNGTYGGAPTRTLVTAVWYPSSEPGGPATDAPLRKGVYPLVLHSHGFMDNRRGESYLGEQLASRGYVVAAPDYPLSNGEAPGGPTIADTGEQPLDARFVVDQLLEQSADPTSPIAGAIDPTRIGASGLSLGGLTTLLFAFHPTSRDPRLRAALAMAPPSCMFTAPFFATTSLPLLLLHGDSDMVVPLPDNSARAFPLTQSPSELVVLRNASHTGFTGLAALLDQTAHLDRIACQALAGKTDVTSFSSLGTEDQGIAADPSVCPLPCQGAFVDPALDAERQQELTRAVEQAFFDAELRGDRQAANFVRTRVGAENPEVMAQTK